MKVHSASIQGRRPYNEDEIEIVNNIKGKDKNLKSVTYCAVYDGHGGGWVSKNLQLARYFVHQLAEPIKPKRSYDKHITKVYSTVQQRLINSEVKANTMGSTALVCCFYKHHDKTLLKVVNLGDCRAVMCNNYRIGVPLTKDHKPISFEESQRITTEGGTITFEAGDDPRISGLSVSRCFGDLDCKYISQVPDVFDYSLSKVEFVIMGCDGIWDVLTNQDAVDFVLKKMEELPVTEDNNGRNKKNIALHLVEYALTKGSQDNLSAIIIFP